MPYNGPAQPLLHGVAVRGRRRGPPRPRPGAELSMLTDDPVAAIDIPHFCASEGHEVIETRVAGEDGS